MIDNESQEFIEKLAQSKTGRRLIEYLEKVEVYYADIRNLDQVKPEVRVDALKLLRECLTDKLKVLAGDVVPPNAREYE